ncbi:MAG: Ig-like domain-containing protein, partial [Pseudomonadales bacterium]
TGVLLLTGTDSVANYEQVLRTVTYQDTATDPNRITRTITVVAGETTNPSNTATTTVTFVPEAVALWLSTDDDVASPSGVNGLDSWSAGDVLEFGHPNLAVEPGTSGGTFYEAFSISDFSSDSSANVRAVHFVTAPVTIGSGANSIDLQVGDLLLSITGAETLISNNTLAVTEDDVFIFRPDTIGAYSSGTFEILLEEPFGHRIHAMTLVESDTTIGDTVVTAGTFLFTSGGHDNIVTYQATGAGVGVTSGTSEVLIDGPDIGIGGRIEGLELIEVTTGIGCVILNPGTLLITLNADDGSVGDNGISVNEEDIFYLEVTETTLVAGTTVADATLLVEGADLAIGGENINAISLTSNMPPVAIDDTASTDEDTPVTTGDVLSNDLRSNNAIISAFDAVSANGGTVVNNGDGTFTYTPTLSL